MATKRKATPSAINTMPMWESFNDDEEWLASFVVGAARSGGTLFEGRLLECRVARLIGGELPPKGVHPWDVRLWKAGRPINIEVRSGTSAFSLSGGREGDVWVFVQKSAERDDLGRILPPPAYFVAATSKVEELRACSTRLTVTRAAHLLGAVPEEQLRSRVLATARRG